MEKQNYLSEELKQSVQAVLMTFVGMNADHRAYTLDVRQFGPVRAAIESLKEAGRISDEILESAFAPGEDADVPATLEDFRKWNELVDYLAETCFRVEAAVRKQIGGTKGM